jgi:capsular exopolysaccharide synthesis family protein
MMRTTESRSQAPPSMGDFVALLLRRKWLILLVALPVIGLSILYSYSRTPVYSTSAGVFVRPALTSLTAAFRTTEPDAQTESSLATSVAVATLAKDLMGSSDTPQQLLKRVSANMVSGTQFLTISFMDPDPATAQQGARAFSDAYLQFRRTQAENVIQGQTQSINTQLESVRSKAQAISERLRTLPRGSPARIGFQSRYDVLSGNQLFLENQLVTLSSITTDPGEVVDPASEPTSPATPRHEFDIAIGIVLGLGLGFAVAMAKERSSDVVRSPAELEEKLGIPVVGSIPKTRRQSAERNLVVTGGDRSITADAYRRLRTSVLGVVAPTKAKTILVTSADGSEGKTATVANLGAALAELGRRVIVVSADLRRPGLQRILPGNHVVGLTQGLTDGVSASELLQETGIPNLRFVPTGAQSSQEPVNLLQSERMRELLTAWASVADFVLLDSPPVLGVPDSLVLGREVDGVLFLTDAETSRWDDVVMALDEVERAGGVLLAGVLNGVKISRRDRRTWKARGVAPAVGTGRSRPSTKRSEGVRQEL